MIHSAVLLVTTFQLSSIGWQYVSGDITVHPFTFPNVVHVGDRVVGICYTNSRTMNPAYHWMKNGAHISSVKNVKIVLNEATSSLVIDPVTENDEGNYTCVLRDGQQHSKFTAKLKVFVPPSWVLTPKDQEAFVDSNVSLLCRAKGKPVPEIKWKFVLPNSEPRHMEVDATGAMTIRKAAKSDEGKYVCEADNGIGSRIIAKSVFLAILVPARFENKFSVETVRRGDSATLRCPAKGDDPLAVTWLKDKHDISNERRYEKFETKEEEGLSSEIFIRNVERIDGALYTCVGKNNYGTDERNIKVVVVEVPAPILDVRVQEVWSRSVNLAWSAPYSGNSPLAKYIIQYWRDREAPHKLHEHEVAATQTSAVLTKHLEPGTSYAVTVIAENEVGQGEPSREIQFVTGEEEPSGPPTDIFVEAKGATSLLVQWKPPPREFWNGELKGYYIGYTVDRSSHPHSYKTMDHPTNETMEFLLSDLSRATRYSILVKAFNGAGTGPPSQDIIIKTLEGELPKAPSVSLLSSSPSAISLKWSKTARANEIISGYTLHYQPEKSERDDWTHVPILVSEANRYTVTGLQSGTKYNLYLTASNKFGRGDPSATLSVNTDNSGMQLKLPFNIDLGLIIPVAAGLVALLVVVVVVIIYLRKAKTRRKLEKSAKAEKNSQYTGTTQRYIDMDKARPMLPPDQGSETYDFIPSRDNTLDSRYGNGKREMKTFLEEQKKASYSRPNSLKKGGGFVGVYEMTQ